MEKQAVGLFSDLEKAYETTWQCSIIRDLHRIGLRVSRAPSNPSLHLDHTLRWVLPRWRSPPGSVLAVACFGIKINELPSHIAMDIFRALGVGVGVMGGCGAGGGGGGGGGWGVWVGDRDTTDALPNDCSFKARLWMYCVWQSMKY